MNTRDRFLIEVFEEIVAPYAPEPEECRNSCCHEEGGQEEDEGRAGHEDDEDERTEESEDEGDDEGEDGEGTGHCYEEPECRAGEGDVGG